jgi:hypothetical protein
LEANPRSLDITEGNPNANGDLNNTESSIDTNIANEKEL